MHLWEVKSSLEMVPEGQDVEEDHAQLRWLCQAGNVTTVGLVKERKSKLFAFGLASQDLCPILSSTRLTHLLYLLKDSE